MGSAKENKNLELERGILQARPQFTSPLICSIQKEQACGCAPQTWEQCAVLASPTLGRNPVLGKN